MPEVINFFLCVEYIPSPLLVHYFCSKQHWFGIEQIAVPFQKNKFYGQVNAKIHSLWSAVTIADWPICSVSARLHPATIFG